MASLTAFKVENLRPKDERYEIPDGRVPGLHVTVNPSGRKTWGLRYRRKSDQRLRHLTLGWMTLGNARKLATDALDEVARGGDPCAAKQAAKHAPARVDDIEAALRLFLDKHVTTRSGKAIRASTKYEQARLLGLRRDPETNAWVATGGGVLRRWQRRKLQDIASRDVRDLLDELAATAPIVANRTHAVLKTFFALHKQRDPDLMTRSPCDGVRKPAPEQSRDRVLSDAEVAALWRVSEHEGYPFGPMVRMLILTGCRLDEVRAATFDEFDFEARQWLIPARRVKNGRDHLVPLTDAMISIIESLPKIGSKRLLFTTNGQAPPHEMFKRRLRLHAALVKELGTAIAPWTLHDLRRTFVTGLQRLDVRLEVAEACVNHASGSVSGVTAVYARHAYADEKREAFEAWSRHVMRLLDPRDAANVVPLVRAS